MYKYKNVTMSRKTYRYPKEYYAQKMREHRERKYPNREKWAYYIEINDQKYLVHQKKDFKIKRINTKSKDFDMNEYNLVESADLHFRYQSKGLVLNPPKS